MIFESITTLLLSIFLLIAFLGRSKLGVIFLLKKIKADFCMLKLPTLVSNTMFVRDIKINGIKTATALNEYFLEFLDLLKSIIFFPVFFL